MKKQNKKIKLKLGDLKVQSFITALSDEDSQTVQGGQRTANICVIHKTAPGICGATANILCIKSAGQACNTVPGGPICL